MYHINLATERIGEIRRNKNGSKMEVVVYNNANDILVKFEQGNPIKSRWRHFLNGSIVNPYDKTVLGIGYLGEGNYKSTENGKHTPQYTTWINMMKRCYDEKEIKRYPKYKECTVAEEWYNFQIFAQWYDDNYYEIEGETMCLDKDILHKGNKIYSPETCIFVPNRINLLFTKRDAKRGNFPIGVSWCKRDKKYQSKCKSASGKDITLGNYNAPEEAFYAYKKRKRKSN
jgi:hypothetical protein